MHVQTEFSISARTSLPNTPSVELARVKRSSRKANFIDAGHPADPGPNEIDLRFRREVGAPPEAGVAVCYLGAAGEQKHGRGASYLAQALNRAGTYQISIENGAPLGPNIAPNTLVYLVGQGSFELEQGLMNGLRNYVHRGMGTLFIESVDEAAEASFLNFLDRVDMTPEPLVPGHRLLTQPNLFAAPPAGSMPEAASKILVGDGVIFDTCNYGLLWQGERQERLATREEIRSAVEWGSNIITYALERRRLLGGK